MAKAEKYLHEIHRAFDWVKNEYESEWSLYHITDHKFKLDKHNDSRLIPVNIYFHKFSELDHSCYTAWKDISENDNRVRKCKMRICENRTDYSVYRRKTVGIKIPRFKIDPAHRRLLALVHEITHLFERELYWKGGEVKTTFNELKFAYEHFYDYFKRGKVIVDKRKKPNYGNVDYNGIKCVVTEDDLKHRKSKNYG